MSIQEPSLPAIIPSGDGPYTEELETAFKLFKEELASEEGWEDQGEQNGVQLYSKPDPVDAYAVPTVKGEAVVPGITSDEFLACIQLPGMRRRWDPRFEDGFMLERYNRNSYHFYSVMKGMGWLVYARDIAGAQKNYKSTEANKEIHVVQTSVESDHAPEQSGKTRATLTISGWHLKPEADGLKVTYLVKISLNGSIPMAMVNMVAKEIPLCVGRVRDVYESLGHAPYVRPTSSSEPTVTFQTEHISDPGATPDDHGDLEYRTKFTTSADGEFDIVYSSKMYPEGISASIDGEGATAEDGGDGVVKVKCTQPDKVASVVISPK